MTATTGMMTAAECTTIGMIKTGIGLPGIAIIAIRDFVSWIVAMRVAVISGCNGAIITGDAHANIVTEIAGFTTNIA